MCVPKFTAVDPRRPPLAGRLGLRTLVLASLIVVLDASAVPAAVDNEVAPTEPPTFDVWEYRIRGNKLLPTRSIERVIYRHLGPDKNIETVEVARSDLEKAYQEAGFGTVLVDIPEQDVVGGVVYLDVAEGEIERLKVSGSRYFSLGRIRRAVPSLAEGQTPYVPAVQAEIQRLNAASPDRKITPILRPGRSPGMTDVELVVEDHLPLHGSVSLNGRNTKDTTRTRLGAALRYDNLWQREHSIGMQFQVTPEDPSQTKVVSGSYLFRLPQTDALVALYGVVTDSDVFAGSDINVIGNGNIVGTRVIMPLPELKHGYHRASIGFDYKDFDESVGLLGTDTFNTPISYHLFELGYTVNHIAEHGTTELGVAVSFAVRNLGNTQKEFENKRFLAKPNFAYLNATFEHQQYFAHAGYLRLGINGQIADSPLISNEQFSAGGLESVRGYFESQHLTDHGLRASVEYHSQSIAGQVWSGLQDLHGVVFVDGAYLQVIDALPNQNGSFTLYSVGLGLHVAALSYFRGRIYLGWALKDSDRVARGDPRVHFDLGYKF